jgi:hypothetical protein
MRKAIIAAISALSTFALTVPVNAVTGHIIQVHHGGDCVEFVLLEDADAASCVQETGFWMRCVWPACHGTLSLLDPN